MFNTLNLQNKITWKKLKTCFAEYRLKISLTRYELMRVVFNTWKTGPEAAARHRFNITRIRVNINLIKVIFMQT